jgi:hypothetical protein
MTVKVAGKTRRIEFYPLSLESFRLGTFMQQDVGHVGDLGQKSDDMLKGLTP